MKHNKYLSNSTLILIIIAVLTLILFILGISSYYHLKNVSKEIGISNTTMEENHKKLAELKELEQAEAQLKMSLEVLQKKIPQLSSEYRIIDAINKYTKDNELDLIHIQFGEYIENGDLNHIPLNLSFTGKYADLVTFLTTLENGERLIRVDGIDITRKEELNGEIRADIVASAFCKKQVN